jgi:hypothetical protein
MLAAGLALSLDLRSAMMPFESSSVTRRKVHPLTSNNAVAVEQ